MNQSDIILGGTIFFLIFGMYGFYLFTKSKSGLTSPPQSHTNVLKGGNK